MNNFLKLKELAEAATKGQWTCASRPYGPFWQISSDHTVDGKDLQGASRQAIASYHAASKRNQPAYAAMFEANAKFAAAACPKAVLGLIALNTQHENDCKDAERDYDLLAGAIIEAATHAGHAHPISGMTANRLAALLTKITGDSDNERDALKTECEGLRARSVIDKEAARWRMRELLPGIPGDLIDHALFACITEAMNGDTDHANEA